MSSYTKIILAPVSHIKLLFTLSQYTCLPADDQVSDCSKHIKRQLFIKNFYLFRAEATSEDNTVDIIFDGENCK